MLASSCAYYYDVTHIFFYFSGLWLGLPACLQEYDPLVKDFLATSDEAARKNIIEKLRKRQIPMRMKLPKQEQQFT